MDWKLVATTFGTILLAELGDKTQLATLTFATSSQNRWAVFLGSSLALVTASAMAVLAGDTLVRYVNPKWLERVAGVAFVVIGLWVLWSARE